MKINRTYRIPLHALNFPPTTIARFGTARLVRHFDGPYELVGGTPEDRTNAQKFCSLFAPEVVFPVRTGAILPLPSARTEFAIA